MKFKIGDKVRIKDLRGLDEYEPPGIVDEMIDMGGEVHTIERFIGGTSDIEIQLAGVLWTWSEDMLELVEEEKEVKDIEWLRKEIHILRERDAIDEWTHSRLLSIINQLPDEPEITEEQAWYFIAKKYNQDGSYWFDARNHYLNTIEKVMVEKPEIPHFVAEEVDKLRAKKQPLYAVSSQVLNFVNHEEKWKKWADKHEDFSEVFINAYLFGYAVKEPKYTVCAEVIIDDEVYSRVYLFRNNYGRIETGHNKDLYNKGKERYQLTEKEIKTYAPDFWVLAKLVE